MLMRLQVQELKESVQQQTAMAKAAARQADMLPAHPVPGETVMAHPLPFSDWGTGVRETLAINVGSEERMFVDVEFNYTDELLVRQKQVYRLRLPSLPGENNRIPSELLHMTFELPKRAARV